MSLPPALLQRLAQRGLVQKQKDGGDSTTAVPNVAENEEVIAEDYDEMETDDHQNGEEYQYPSQYDYDIDTGRKRTEENFWVERMRARMGEAGSAIGHKGCPNKYNIWHKCTLYCVNRWADGIVEPSRDYTRRYKRLLRKYPLPKGWNEVYDPGCGCYYFCNATDNVVSWLPPTHPNSQVTKSAAAYRRQMEEVGEASSEDEEDNNDDSNEDDETSEARHQREVLDIINSTLKGRPKSPATLGAHNFPAMQESTSPAAKSSRKPQR